MLRHLVRETISSNWKAHRAAPALPCATAIAGCLFVSLLLGHPTAGMIMAGGALPVGFGAFQTLGRSRKAPMFLGALCITMAALAGSLTPHTMAWLACTAAGTGLICGLLGALSPGSSWIGLQSGVAALLASGYPGSTQEALGRAALILLGGLVQAGVVLLFWKLHPPFYLPVADETFAGFAQAGRILWGQFTCTSEHFRYGLHLAATLCLGALLARGLALQNGYWVPMTTLLVLRTDARQTVPRGIARIAGTLVGAGLATVLAHGLHPGLVVIGLLAVLFAWLCYSLIPVNYGLFAICLTAYIAFLLAFGGLTTNSVIAHRIANTALGGGLALLSYAPRLWRSPAQAEPAGRV